MTDRVSETKAYSDYIKKDNFEAMKEIQDCERGNIYMSRPTLDLTPIGLKKNFSISPQKNGKEHFTISPSQSGKENSTISPLQNGKAHFTISQSQNG